MGAGLQPGPGQGATGVGQGQGQGQGVTCSQEASCRSNTGQDVGSGAGSCAVGRVVPVVHQPGQCP